MEAHDVSTFRESLYIALDSLGLALDGDAVDRCAVYYERLTEWNARMNLTRIEDAKSAAEKHFADALLPLRFSLLPQRAKAIDVGTGAGFPGVVLAIARPDIRLTLLDSLQKRIGFLKELCEEIGVQAELIHARAEDAGRAAPHRGKYDVALSRAVAPAPVLLELVLPFVRVGGHALCYKGGNVREEFDAARTALQRLQGELVDTHETECLWGTRSIAVVRQKRAMPAAYPRRAGLPAKQPLG